MKIFFSKHPMMNFRRKWVLETNVAPILKHQKQNLKQQWIWDLMNSNLKQSASLTQNYQLTLQINLLLPTTNLMLISSNFHSSSHLKNPNMHHNSPKIYHSWPLKATNFFRLKNGVMPSLLPSANIFQQKRTAWNTNISNQKITIYIFLSSHQTPILNSLQQNKTMDHSQEHSEFILWKIELFPTLNHQNHMSN